MMNILNSIKETIVGIESPIALVPLACIPVVGTIVQVVKEKELFSNIRHTRNQGHALIFLREKNRISTISCVGLAVQGIAIFAIAVFAGGGFYSLIALVPFALLIAYNINKINYNQHSIEKLQGGSIFVPRVR
jgi:hypothetical protein